MDDTQPRSLMGMLWIVARLPDHFVDLQPEAIELWKPDY